MSLPCIPCAEPQVCLENLDKYSLQDEIFHVILRCPPGSVCGTNNFLFLLCCDGNQLRVSFTPGMTLSARTRLIDEAVAECERRRAFCEPPPPPDCPVPPCEVEYFYSAPGSCTILCPDGTPFTFTVPAGLFLAKTFAEAQAAANAYACEQAPNQIFCLPSLVACACVGSPFNAVLAASPSKPLKFLIVAGTVPLGLSIPVGVVSNGVLRIQGTPLSAGNFPFTIRAIDANNNFIDKNYLLSVVGITNTSLPNFTIGTPYSYQLTAAGGTGPYLFGIGAGSLPDGLGISSSGLISGTPTNLAVDSTITFEVVDSFCEEPNPRMFVPRASMTTSAVTQLATVLGYLPFVQSIPPKRYKQVQFTGAALEVILDSATDTARYSEYIQFSGIGLIDINGNQVSSYTKDVQGRIGDLAQPWYSRGNKATNTSSDNSGFLYSDTFYSSTPDSLHKNVVSPEGDPSGTPPPKIIDPVYPAGSPLIGTIPANGIQEYIATPYSFPPEASTIYPSIPDTVINGIIGKWINFVVRFDYQVSVSVEYTDSEALSVAATSISTSNISRNEPRKLGYTSRYVTVTYTISLTNLVVGQVYNVVVPLHGDNGTNSSILHTFTAVSTIHSITGTAPTPTAWVSVEVRPPLVSFA